MGGLGQARRLQAVHEAGRPGKRSDSPDRQPPLEDQSEGQGRRAERSRARQGGRQHGYALHFVDGRPAFDVRVNGKVTRLIAPEAVSGEITLSAILDREIMTLAVNDGETLVGASPASSPSNRSTRWTSAPTNARPPETTSRRTPSTARSSRPRSPPSRPSPISASGRRPVRRFHWSITLSASLVPRESCGAYLGRSKS